MKNINESGRSMVEMLGVLAIIGVLSVGGIAGYSKAMNKYKINKTTDQVSMLVANIRTLFSTQGNYTGLNNASAIRFGVVPNDMYSGTPGTSATSYDIKNAFNGAVEIKVSNARKLKTSENDAFIIKYDGLSQEACVTVATGDWGSGQASGLIGIAAGSTANIYTGTSTIEATYVDSSSGSGDSATVSASGSGDVTATSGKVVGIPGGSTVSTPISVTNAVTACTGGGSGNAVAWKYY
jgi:type II secretory pathway pseudopilin PulG